MNQEAMKENILSKSIVLTFNPHRQMSFTSHLKKNA
jgi:hypothetical protein